MVAAEVGGGGATWTVYTGPQWPPLLGLVRDQDPVQS